MSLSVGVAKIFATDVSNLSKKLRSTQRRGVSFDGNVEKGVNLLIQVSESICSICKEPISVDGIPFSMTRLTT
jgi:hypothetical protein